MASLAPSDLVDIFVSASRDFERWTYDFRRGEAAFAKTQSVVDELERRGTTDCLLPLLRHDELVVRGLAAKHLIRRFPNPSAQVLLDASAEPGVLPLKFKLWCYELGLIDKVSGN